MVVRAEWDLALFCFKRTLFRLTNTGFLRLKISWTPSVVENKNPHRLHVRLEQTPSESHLQTSTRHTTLLWGRTEFFNDDFGRLTGTEPLFRGVRISVKDPFFITCGNSPDKSIIHGISDRMTTDVHVEPVEVSIHEVQIYSSCMIFQVS